MITIKALKRGITENLTIIKWLKKIFILQLKTSIQKKFKKQ